MSTYDTDFYAWTQAQAAALRAKDVAALALDHLAEETGLPLAPSRRRAPGAWRRCWTRTFGRRGRP